MTYLKNNKLFIPLIFLATLFSCKKNNLPVVEPVLRTQKTPHDTDDPAIWINKSKPEKSIIFGTDKDEINGGVYAFDLDGKIIKDKSITNLSYPNNVDVSYGFKLNDSTNVDVIGFTEREKNQIRLFSVPDMKMLDNGGLKVFEDESNMALKRPMGIAFYKKSDNDLYVIVSRKEGSKNHYLYQYLITSDSASIGLKLVRKFGAFSGKKEIEAIAVDQELGYVYYSDEDHCIRKYYVDPSKGNEELACFGAEYFKRDIEGIAIVKTDATNGYIVVSNQQAHSFSVFDRKTNTYLKQINLGTVETDGCDATTVSLGDKFPNGLFVSMTDSKEFIYHNLKILNLRD